MNFDEKLSMLISEAEIPEQLSPENTALMLKQKTADKNKKPSVPAISMKSKKQAMIFRSTAAIVACFALVFGIMAFVNNKGTALPAGYLDNDVEVREAENYSDVYKGIQDAFVKNGKIIDDERAYLTTKSDHYRSYDDKSYHYDFARRSILLREIKDKIINSCKE